jgi:hypothetical protein
LALVILLAVAVGVGWAYYRDVATRQPEPGPSPTVTPNYDVPRRELDALPVKGWDRAQDFDRARQRGVRP